MCGDLADRRLVVAGEQPAADFHLRDGETLAGAHGVDPHPVDGGGRVDDDCVPWPLSKHWSTTRSAWYNSNTSASKTALFDPKWQRRPDQLPSDCQAQAAPTSPLSRREPSVQMVSRRLHPLAVTRAPALPPTTMPPGKRQLVLHSCTSTVSPRRRAAARSEGGAFPGQDLLRSVPVAESCVEALGGPGLTVV